RRVLPDRDPPAVVLDGHRAVEVDRHVHAIAEACERLVDGVVDDLVDHVVQTGAVVGVADVHPRALPHGLQALENLDTLLVVNARGRPPGSILLAGCRAARWRGACHGRSTPLRVGSGCPTDAVPGRLNRDPDLFPGAPAAWKPLGS